MRPRTVVTPFHRSVENLAKFSVSSPLKTPSHPRKVLFPPNYTPTIQEEMSFTNIDLQTPETKTVMFEEEDDEGND